MVASEIVRNRILLLGIGYWVQGLRCFPWMEVIFFLKDGMRVDPSTLQILQNSSNSPMVAKPFYEILSDYCYIFGEHRMPYIELGDIGMIRILVFGGKEVEKNLTELSTQKLDLGGKLRADASNGNTGVYVNSHKISKAELRVFKITFWCDSKVVIDITINHVFHERTKHIKIECHVVRDQYKVGFILPYHITSKLRLADVFAKALHVVPFAFILSKMSLWNAHLEEGLLTYQPRRVAMQEESSDAWEQHDVVFES